MRERSNHDQDVEDLMRRPKYVKGPGLDALREPKLHYVYPLAFTLRSSSHLFSFSHQDSVFEEKEEKDHSRGKTESRRQAGLFRHLLESEFVDAVDDGREARQPGHDEDDEAKGAPFGALKVRQHHDNNTDEPQGAAHAPVDFALSSLAPETDVDARHKRPNNQYNNADEIKPQPTRLELARVRHQRVVRARDPQTRG
ncbi:hypothetical protein NPX13_g8502 [Xylaria arbuscula]|uniref:Uncharacterized protein n=1 Tax=Xylaria arbuscula TaxID=114810 RepID=A0A9W8N821_9PEZI|nr:hypothetical protein NPX13_g8502 [Xylaria arbuscula]